MPDAMPMPSLWRRLDSTGVPLMLCRLVLGVLFVVMGANKIGDPVHFLKTIRDYQLVSETLSTPLNLMAVILPWLEVVCGIVLLLGVAIRGASLLLASMLLVFTTAIFLRAWRIYTTQDIPFTKIEFDCGCGFGPTIIYRKLLENLGLIVLAVMALCSRSRKLCLPLTFRKPATSPLIPAPVDSGA